MASRDDQIIDLGLDDSLNNDKWIVQSANNLPEALVELQNTHRQAIAQYRAFELTPDELVDVLADLTVVDADGYTWTMGTKSGSWFKAGESSEWELTSAGTFARQATATHETAPEAVKPAPRVALAASEEPTPEADVVAEEVEVPSEGSSGYGYGSSL